MIRFTEAFLNFDTQFVDEIIPANYLITWLTGFWGRAHKIHAAASKKWRRYWRHFIHEEKGKNIRQINLGSNF